jgi:glyoxylase-like metal-dependent hydrolase (beta-lactamase superfamily II)
VLTQVADGVLVHRSGLLENNTVVVEGRDGVLVVDAGITGAELTCLAGDLEARGLPVVAGFATHPDWDHVLWHAALGDVPRLATARCASSMQTVRSDPDWRIRAAEGLPPEIAGDVPLDLFGLLTGLPEDAEQVPWDGPRVRIVEHRGHAPGHAALLVEDSRVLVAGDMLSDVLVPMLDVDGSPDPVGDYLDGLRRLAAVADDVDVLVPGHGSVGDADELRARLARDTPYVEALAHGGVTEDPRLGPSARPGWEWVDEIHTGQLDGLARRSAGS